MVEPVAVGLHVADLDGASAQHNKAKWTAGVSISVVGDDGNPVPGAAVSGSWSGGEAGAASCTTDETGGCTVATGLVSSREASLTFSVENIAHATHVYQPADNVDPDGDSDGSAITVYRP
jgi:hypothetical protein